MCGVSTLRTDSSLFGKTLGPGLIHSPCCMCPREEGGSQGPAPHEGIWKHNPFGSRSQRTLPLYGLPTITPPSSLKPPSLPQELQTEILLQLLPSFSPLRFNYLFASISEMCSRRSIPSCVWVGFLSPMCSKKHPTWSPRNAI